LAVAGGLARAHAIRGRREDPAKVLRQRDVEGAAQGQERTSSPLLKAASTSARVVPGARSPMDHSAPGKSWPCSAVSRRTTSAGPGLGLADAGSIHWAARRSLAIVFGVTLGVMHPI